MKRYLFAVFCLLVCLVAAARQRIKIACVGNSITYGYGLPDREVQAYPARLQKMLGDGYEVGNFGKSGATLLSSGHRPYIRQEEYRKAIEFAPDIAVIHLGINDTDPRDWPHFRDSFVKDYIALIDAFRQANPDVRILIARMTPIADRHPRFLSGTRDWHGEIQAAIETVARCASVRLIDFHAPLYPYPFLLPDAVHPTAEGAALLAKTVYSAVTGDYGGLKVSPLYTDNMVLQRDVPLSICGTADAGERVTVTVGGQQRNVRAGTDGKWKADLLPMRAGGPFVLKIAGSRRSFEFRNVWVGEVWLCSGQSNMEFMLKEAASAGEDIPQAADEQLMFYDMKARWRTDAVEWEPAVLDSLNRLRYYADTRWQPCTPSTAAAFSAVAYHFGRMLRDSLQVPVGLICNAVGGSPTEAWIDRRTLEYEFPAILKDWMQNDYIQDWVRGRAALNLKKSAGKYARHPYEPCYLFESGILPLQRYPLRGVIWYQGESNAHNETTHEKLFRLLVRSWRENWKNESMPFYYVQLSSLHRPSWPWFRDSQRRLMASVPYTGMAVCTDRGDSLNVHPADKKPVGERLARWALHSTYGKETVVPSGPLFRSADFRGGAVRLTFDYGEAMGSADGMPLRSFELAETEGLYYPAKAEVAGGKVKVYADKVARPRYVRYAWEPFTRANLVNGAGLPASGFRAEVRQTPASDIRMQAMKGFPKGEKGFDKGGSACYAGILSGRLLIAGGCNFPGVPAAQGGKKKYYRHVYAADFDADSVFVWRKVGELPAPAAYGAAVTTADGVVCIGGTNEKGAMNDVYRLRWDESRRRTFAEPLPSLPFALDNFTASLSGERIFVAGGNRDGKPSNTFLCLDLQRLSEGWQSLPDFPGPPRIQPVSAVGHNGKESCFYLWGGFAPAADGKEPTLSVDGYAYVPSSGRWIPVAAPAGDDGESVSLGGGVAAAMNDSLILCMGGVNKDIFLSALRAPAKDYLLHPAEWYRFNRKVLVYNVRSDEWQEITETSSTARAGAALVGIGNRFFSINGELKPGIRTPEIIKISFP